MLVGPYYTFFIFFLRSRKVLNKPVFMLTNKKKDLGLTEYCCIKKRENVVRCSVLTILPWEYN